MQTDSSFLSMDELYSAVQEFAERRKWHLKYAKFNWRSHQSLLTHSLNVGSLSSSILDFLSKNQFIKVTEKLHMQMVLTGFLHDSGKESETFQKAVETFLASKGSEPLDFGHQQEKELLPIIESLKKDIEDKLPKLSDPQGILEEVIWSVSQLGRREDAAAVSHSFKKVPSNDALICKEIVHFADLLMSKLTVEDAASTPLNGQILSQLSLVYSKVSTVRGVLTHFLHNALEDQFKDRGFEPVLWFPNGTVYIGTKEVDVPVIDENRLVESIKTKMKGVLEGSRSKQIAKAAFGGLTYQVIAAPEFLFADDKIIHLFWQFISRQRFAKPNIKKVKELSDSENKLFKLLSENLKNENESKILVYLARFIADFNLLIILYAARKQLIDNIIDKKNSVELEATQEIKEILVQTLEFPMESIHNWPEIALQTKTEKRLTIALSFWQSAYYDDPETWRIKLLEALEKSTIKLAKIWRNLIPEKYVNIANLLVSDISSPISPKAMFNEIQKLNSVIEEGKSGHGTPICQRCGGVAIHEAQAKLFGTSEIYNDNLIAGMRVGGGNKIQVCELCEFEEKLRSIFTGGQDTFSFFLFPQLALSRKQQSDWQATVNSIQYNQGAFPPLLRTDKWAERVIEGGPTSMSFSYTPQERSAFSEKELARAIQYVADTYALENDLSSMIEPGLDAEDGKAIATFLQQGKCKLKEDYEGDVYIFLNRLEPVYISPNFILVLTRGTVAEKGEPESSAEVKWTLFRSLLARMFSATVVSKNFIAAETASLGYTPISSNIILKPMAEKLNARKGWITIPELEGSIRRLSSLVLIARELSNAGADYGRATLLRLLNEEPGRVLYRMTSKSGQKIPKKLIDLLDVWYYGK